MIQDSDPPLFKFCSVTIVAYSLWQTNRMSLFPTIYVLSFSLRKASHYTNTVTLQP